MIINSETSLAKAASDDIKKLSDAANILVTAERYMLNQLMSMSKFRY